ncbi:hypothetical protein VKT23_019210 [Stygiomarasmius scandens]|uniref:Lectin n=1 Tax=Marasmiellus scandens TaxID=2682957 RepID=A0ABR1IR47_9AGAR
MTYTITVRIYQTNPNAFFQLVEKTIWHYANGGTWTEAHDEHVLTMGGSGTSGLLRFSSNTGEFFTVALGVHNYVRWCDIVPNLPSNQTGCVILPEYYNNQARGHQREKQLESFSVNNATGRQLSVVYTVKEGNDLRADIIIG